MLLNTLSRKELETNLRILITLLVIHVNGVFETEAVKVGAVSLNRKAAVMGQ
jgi:hypothetical protein